jgi:hypothetical protein
MLSHRSQASRDRCQPNSRRQMNMVMKNALNSTQEAIRILLSSLLVGWLILIGVLAQPVAAAQEPPVSGELRDGQHDFDFNNGGRTWEPNFVATLTREEGTTSGAEIPSLPASEVHEGAHNFDFNFGTWKTHIRRLQNPLTGSRTWVDYAGTSVVSKVWGGRASLFELEATGPTGTSKALGCGSSIHNRINGV